MQISIIIPTYNRAQYIIHTLDSLLNQSLPKDFYEIIICNNSSSDETENVVLEFINANKVYNLLYLYEPRAGVHYARNSSVKHAKGDFLYFTDDDMIADYNMLKSLLDLISYDERISSATGKVLPIWEKKPKKWVFQICYNYLLSLNNPEEELVISKNDINIFSCHQIVRKDIFLKSGGFNPENTRGEWIGDGETGLNNKIKDLGGLFAYTSKSITYHCIPSSRTTQSYLNKRLKNQGNCDSYTRYKVSNKSNINLLYNILKHFIQFNINFFKLIYYLLMFNNKFRLKFSYFYYFYSRILYDIKLISSKKFREIVNKDNWLEIN
jgi:glycosyltransferase involved in cell wall biosynthesis